MLPGQRTSICCGCSQKKKENRRQLTGYSASVMEDANWKMNAKKNNTAELCATRLLFNKYSVV